MKLEVVLILLCVVIILIMLFKCYIELEFFELGFFGFDDKVLSNDNRLDYYMGNLKYKTTITKSDINKNINKNISIISNEFLKNYHSTGNIYFDEIFQLYNNNNYKNNKNIIFKSGDVNISYDIPTITKTAPIDRGFNVILNLDKNRHWDSIKEVKLYDIPFNEKNDKLIWRGVTTNIKKRLPFVKRYIDNNKMDIGFNKIGNGVEKTKELELLLKPLISIKNMLKSRFLISIEGNDVATNLKWILYSNSVCLKSQPTIISWLMEDKLIPWYHYVPLEPDYSDIEEKYEWCLNNLKKCDQISKNATKYIKVFLNDENEEFLMNQIFKRYTELVDLTISK